MGIWSRSLCVEQGLRHGSMLPYVDTAIKQDYAVIICNPLVNAAAVKDPNTGLMQKVRRPENPVIISVSSKRAAPHLPESHLTVELASIW